VVTRLSFVESVSKFALNPITALGKLSWLWRGSAAARKLAFSVGRSAQPEPPNDLERYFQAVKKGPGIWKWVHYFEIYDRHLAKFRNKEVSICEVGIYSGGSLGMWRQYFGPRCRVYGVDIEESCKAYEGDGIEVFIGDQADRGFWRDFRRQVPEVDIIIDDGGHHFNQQATTLEQMLPHLRPGGVYICEDIHGTFNNFTLYVSGLSWSLNGGKIHRDPDQDNRRLTAQTSAFQSSVHSIHLYPFVAVIERRCSPVAEFVAPKRGTQWQPFLK